MTIRIDPEGNESKALFEIADFVGKRVLEIGSGDGRLTWIYAERAGRVTSIEPFTPSFEQAKRDMPPSLEGRVDFRNVGFLDFSANSQDGEYDTAILSWSL